MIFGGGSRKGGFGRTPRTSLVTSLHSHDHPLEMLTDLAIGQSESSTSLKIIFLGGSNFRETPVN